MAADAISVLSGPCQEHISGGDFYLLTYRGHLASIDRKIAGTSSQNFLIARESQSSGSSLDKDASDCLAERDIQPYSGCGKPGGVRLMAKNGCSIPVDFKVCIQRSNGRPSCGVSYMVKPSESISPWVCEGTGKMWWQGLTGAGMRFADEANINWVRR